MTNYTMEGRTYRYFEGDPLYPFGYGLSYTTFQYSDLKLSSSSIQMGQSIEAEVTVQNTGGMDADEVCGSVLCFWAFYEANSSHPNGKRSCQGDVTTGKL